MQSHSCLAISSSLSHEIVADSVMKSLDAHGSVHCEHVGDARLCLHVVQQRHATPPHESADAMQVHGRARAVVVQHENEGVTALGTGLNGERRLHEHVVQLSKEKYMYF